MKSIIARILSSVTAGFDLRLALSTLLVVGAVGIPIPVHAATVLDATGTRSDRIAGIPGVSVPLVRMFEEQARTLRSLDWLARRHGLRATTEGVLLDVVLRNNQPETGPAIKAVGGRVRSLSSRHHRASVIVDNVAVLASIAGLPMVEYVYPAYRPVRRQGSVDSRAVQALKADTIPGALDGTGLTIGILSDSFARTSDVVDDDAGDGDGTTTTDRTDIDPAGNSTPVTLRDTNPQQSNDLPDTVELRRDDATGSVSDEGAAMAELVHDLAPGADISFYTAFASFGEFAAGLDDLCGPAGADVVVDDVLYFAELMYQRDVISRAAEDCVSGGVSHFSASGNNGDRGFRSRYRDVDTNDTNGNGAAALFGNDFHDWDPGSNSDGLLRITLDDGEGFSALMQWNQPALSVPENSSNGPQIDLDLYLADGSGTILRRSIIDQQASNAGSGADPIELIQYENNTGGIQSVFLGIDHWAGNRDTIPQDEGTDLEFRLVFFESLPSSSDVIDYEYTPGGSTMYGHTVADGVISVGAVPWWETDAFDPTIGPTTATDPESFTAEGGSLQEHFRPDGSFLRRTRAPQPRLAAVDGNNTTFFGSDISPIAGTESDTHPNFFGTSAAAPNAAAVAALLLEDDDSLTPAQVKAKLMTSAVDVTGQNAGIGCDDRTGAGLIDATAAVTASDEAPVARAGSNQSTASGRRVTLDGSTSTDNIGIEDFRWTQVRGAAVSLSNPDGAQTSFDAPNGSHTMVFELRATDAACLSDADRVTVAVKGGSGGGGGGGAGSPILLWLLAMSVAVRTGCRLAMRTRA